jgi:hypothetical protein
MLYTGVFIFIAVAAFIVVSDLQQSEIPYQQNTVAKETGDGFVSAITLAVKGGEGFSYNYTFPETIFALPYRLDLRDLNAANSSLMLEWESSYGNFSYRYGVPRYNYRLAGPCLAAGMMESGSCSNTLMLNNDGENLTITQLP